MGGLNIDIRNFQIQRKTLENNRIYSLLQVSEYKDMNNEGKTG